MMEHFVKTIIKTFSRYFFRKNTTIPAPATISQYVSTTCSAWDSNNIPLLIIKRNFSRKTHFTSVVKEWKRHNINIQNSNSISISKKVSQTF